MTSQKDFCDALLEKEEEEEEESVQEIISDVAEDLVAYTVDNLIEISTSLAGIISLRPPEQPCICSKYEYLLYSQTHIYSSCARVW